MNFTEERVIQDYCVSNCFCFWENPKFRLFLIETHLNQIIQRLVIYNDIYQEIDCLYTLFKHRFCSSIVTSSREVFNQLSRAVQYNLRWKGAENTARKRLIRKNNQTSFSCCNQNMASTQTHGSTFLDRIRKIQNSKNESDSSHLLIVLLIVMVLYMVIM